MEPVKKKVKQTVIDVENSALEDILKKKENSIKEAQKLAEKAKKAQEDLKKMEEEEKKIRDKIDEKLRENERCRAWVLVDNEKVPCGSMPDPKNGYLCPLHLDDFSIIRISENSSVYATLDSINYFLKLLKERLDSEKNVINEEH